MDFIEFKRHIEGISSHVREQKDAMDELLEHTEKRLDDKARLLVFAKVKRAKHFHESSPYPEEASLCQARSAILGKENETTPISTKTPSNSRPRRRLADIGNFKCSRNDSQHSLLKFTKQPKVHSLDTARSNESDEEQIIVQKWCKNYKKSAAIGSYSNIDLCATLFKHRPAVEFNRVFST